MANEVTTTLDPFGRTIFLLSGISITRNEEHGIFDDAATVIKKTCYFTGGKRKQ